MALNDFIVSIGKKHCAAHFIELSKAFDTVDHTVKSTFRWQTTLSLAPHTHKSISTSYLNLLHWNLTTETLVGLPKSSYKQKEKEFWIQLQYADTCYNEESFWHIYYFTCAFYRIVFKILLLHINLIFLDYSVHQMTPCFWQKTGLWFISLMS